MKKLFSLLITILFLSSCSLSSPNAETRQILLEVGAELGSYAIDEYGGFDNEKYAYGKVIVVEGSYIFIVVSDGKTIVGADLLIEENLTSTILKDMNIAICTIETTGLSNNIAIEIDKTSFTLGATLPWNMKDTIKKLYDMEIEDWKWMVSQGLQTQSTNNL